MLKSAPSTRTPCAKCPLQGCGGLRPLDAKQIVFMQDFKQGEMAVDRGTPVLVQGAMSPHLYTILDGVLVRFKLLEDGRRQILNFMFPGDLIGLQGAMDDPLMHGVDALTHALLCVFSRERIFELFVEQPRLSYDVTWLAAREEAALEEHLVTLGQRTAREKIAYLALFLMQRGMETGMVEKGVLRLALTQAQIADTLGLSPVHTNRTLQSLRRAGTLSWSTSELVIADLETAREVAKFEQPVATSRPFI